jgi:opacity protein-like surface antigen
MTISNVTLNPQRLHLASSSARPASRRTWRRIAIGACLLWATHPAAAEIYGSFGLGWNYADILSVPDTQARIDYDFGLPAGSLAIGVERKRWRFELEASHQENEPEVLYFRGSDLAFDSRESDQLAATSILLNAYRTFAIGAGFRPYLGAGLGPAHVDLLFRDDETGEAIIDDSAWTLALQGTIGVDIPITRKLSLGIDYRYWYAPEVSLTDAAGEERDLSQGIHSGWLRANYRFGEGQDPVAPHPAPNQRGLFVAATAGGGWPVDEDLTGTDYQLDAYSIGPMASLSVGYAFRPRWHLALELARRQSDMQIIDYARAGEVRTDGDVRADSLTLNLNYRFQPALAVTPYAGIGAGAQRKRYDLANATDGMEILRHTATGIALQWWLGFEFAIDDNWSATTDYRMWIGDETNLELSDGTQVGARHVAHTMTFGIRYALSR